MTLPPPESNYTLAQVMPAARNKRRRWPWIAGAAAVVVAAAVATALITAGGGQHETAAPTATPTPVVHTQTVGRLYVRTAELRADIESKTSIRCTGYENVPDPKAAIELASCTDELVLGIHTDKDQAVQSSKDVAELVVGILGGTNVQLIGENWSVNCGDDRAACDEIQAALGGELMVTTQK